MVGRYGVDKLGMHILWFCIIMNIVSIFLGSTASSVIFIINDVLLIWQIYRTFSKNYVKRSIENTKYLDFLTKAKRTWKVFRMNMSDKQYHYYLCPDCAQMVRVPRGRGKVEIRCPHCGKTFEKKA